MSDDNISRKKPNYPVGSELRKYLRGYGRKFSASIEYKDLLRFTSAFPHYDRKGKDTLWESVYYPPAELGPLNKALTGMYAQLKTGGDSSVIEHLYAERVDFCTFGNSKPFRIRIVNTYNDNFDYFYVKQADASRIYGLELEHILSPNRISYFVSGNTLVEEHIAGIPGDMFIKNHLETKDYNAIRIAKEFVKFNERCFLRLLGDMRSYNYVVDITPDFEEVHYRIRAIDFDQQSYEGKRTLYMPQYFKQNNAFVKLAIDLMTPETVRQYQFEERTLIAKRIKAGKRMLKDLLDCMSKDTISTPEKTNQLKDELCRYYDNPSFLRCKSMGDLVKQSLKEMLKQNKLQLGLFAAKTQKPT
ncbi:MAG: hypothetical protein JNL88_11845 [Bacteroidia bacterium]|nr:hypothetical protein [Bacteroidia bacterium]